MKENKTSSENEIFNPLKSDNEAMGFPSSNKKWHLKQQPKGIRYIGYTIIAFVIIIFLTVLILYL
ncbi:hypothetical protein ACIQ4I_12880 [Rummeliibacillus sp. NPDC094406]|uniref:hypothetical protein n=1 Tax=Rummeliibacillus sp. NPDC094406 TaxID=3364511 RepID=UPI00381FBCF6